MTFQNLDVIKSRTLLLTVGVPSPEILLADPNGDDIYFVFELLYARPDGGSVTRLMPRDPRHAKIEIEIPENTLLVEPSEPLRVGSYGSRQQPLFIGFVVEPQTGFSDRYKLTVTFYVGKEVNVNGGN